MEQQKPYVIGVDLGGTNTVFGIVDARGQIVAENSVKTQAYSTAQDFFDACMVCLNPLIQQVGGVENIAGMGIGAPNANYYSGCVECAPNICWAHSVNVPLAQMFSDALGGLSVKITNDANAAAMGEMAYGAARGMKNFIVITLGTGVGSGIVINGQLVYGHDGFAGELGHVIMVRGDKGRKCGCGRTGCLEAYCSATGVARTAREILGEACADFAAFSSPEAFIFFGGLCKAGDLIMKPVEESYNRNVMPVFRGKARFLLSSLMNANAAVLGSSALGWEE